MLKNKRKIRSITDRELEDFVVLGLKHVELNGKGFDTTSQITYMFRLGTALLASCAISIKNMKNPQMTKEEVDDYADKMFKEISKMFNGFLQLIK